MVRFTKKFATSMQNEMPMTNGRLKWKPEAEFHYGGRSFSKTVSSYNSAVAWDLFVKSGTLRDPDLLRTSILPN